MSMLSAQIDELRKAAEYYDGSEAASIMRYAADTIWQLRDDLQRSNAENARLREQSEQLFDKTLELATENSKLRELCKLCEREVENATLRQQLADVTESMGRVEERCAKLREQAEKAWKAAEMLCQAWDGPCRSDGASIKPPCPLDERDELCVYGLIQRDLRELGVEANGCMGQS